jgi:hypothetical protein
MLKLINNNDMTNYRKPTRSHDLPRFVSKPFALLIGLKLALEATFNKHTSGLNDTMHGLPASENCP